MKIINKKFANIFDKIIKKLKIIKNPIKCKKVLKKENQRLTIDFHFN